MSRAVIFCSIFLFYLLIYGGLFVISVLLGYAAGSFVAALI